MVFEEYCHISEGEFGFDDLKLHLQSHCVPKIVSVGEDAKRVIARIDYNNQTNRLVGFVLPCENDGLPIADSFLATYLDQLKGHLAVLHFPSMLLCTWPKLCVVMFLRSVWPVLGQTTSSPLCMCYRDGDIYIYIYIYRMLETGDLCCKFWS